MFLSASTFEDFEKLSQPDQVSFYQIAALFESLGVLAERNIVKLEVIEDMFLTEFGLDDHETVCRRYAQEIWRGSGLYLL